MRLRPGKKLQWQFPIELKIHRYGWRLSFCLIVQPPLVRRMEFEILNLSGWLGDEDLDER
jgi:hypothetical protein